MEQPQFINNIKNLNTLNALSINDLENIIKEYPFFETAHLLYVRELKKNSSILYPKQLRKTAIIANSRVILHDLLHPNENILITTSPSIISVNENLIEDKKSLTVVDEKAIDKKNTSAITTTANDIQVIYVNTVAAKSIKKIEEPQKEEISISQKPLEIELLQAIENETEPKHFDVDKLNKTIEQEIGRGIVQSYIESDILKTTEINKIEKSDPVSFTDWLHKIKKEAHTIQKSEGKKEENTVSSIEKETIKEEKSSFFSKNRSIIDKIIESDPGKLKLGTNKFFTPNIDAKQSLLENEHLVTETLAKIYALQGNINKAIRAYEILSLKFPQKSVYFTSLIKNLKK